LIALDAGAELDPYSKGCPSRDLLDRIGDKWSILLLGELAGGQPRRFAVLRNRIEGISEKMLTQALRRLEEDGLVARRVYPEVPPRVEYTLTALGHTLRAPLGALRQWSIEHAAEVLSARAAYAQRTAAQPAAGRRYRH
jgi:DNA-binding HxlR family transcriptional regulator